MKGAGSPSTKSYGPALTLCRDSPQGPGAVCSLFFPHHVSSAPGHRGHQRATSENREGTAQQPDFVQAALLHSGSSSQWLPTATACSGPVCLSSSSMLLRQLWQTHSGISPRRFFTSFGMKSGGSFSPCNTSPFWEGPSSQPLRSR